MHFWRSRPSGCLAIFWHFESWIVLAKFSPSLCGGRQGSDVAGSSTVRPLVLRLSLAGQWEGDTSQISTGGWLSFGLPPPVAGWLAGPAVISAGRVQVVVVLLRGVGLPTHFNKKTVELWGFVLHYERLQLYLFILLMPVHGYLLYL